MTSNPAHDILQPSNLNKNDGNQKLTFYCAWFCPYAHRVWMVLQYFNIPYHYQEIQLYEPVPNSFSISRARISLDKKPKDFVNVSPYGLVPALNHEGKGIHESILCMDYLQDVYGSSGGSTGKSLLPSDPFQRFLMRKIMLLIDNKIIKYYYEALMEKDEEAQKKAQDNFESGLEEFGMFMLKHSTDGSNYCIGPDMSIADIALAPWFYRIDIVLTPLLGFELKDSSDAFKRVKLWWESVSSHPCVNTTFVKKEALLEAYTGYSS